MTSVTDDEARWSEAQSILDRTPTESAARRLRRSQRTTWLLVASVVVSGLALGAVVVVVLLAGGHSPSPGDDVPTAQAATGFGVSAVGLLVMVFGLWWHSRGARGARAYGSPLRVLTRHQRKELLAQVRGRTPVEPERGPLARHVAGLMKVQWLVIIPQTGLLLNFTGLWIAAPATWRMALVGTSASIVLVAAVVLGRNSRRAQRFLDQHPQDGPRSSAG